MTDSIGRDVGAQVDDQGRVYYRTELSPSVVQARGGPDFGRLWSLYGIYSFAIPDIGAYGFVDVTYGVDFAISDRYMLLGSFFPALAGGPRLTWAAQGDGLSQFFFRIANNYPATVGACGFAFIVLNSEKV